MAVYEPRTRFQPWTYEEMARVPMAQAQRDVVGYDLTSKMKGLDTKAYTDADKEYLQKFISPVEEGATSIAERIASGEKVDKNIMTELFEIKDKYKEASDFLSKYKEAATNTLSQIASNPYSKEWSPEKVQQQRELALEKGFITSEGEIKPGEFYIPKRYNITNDARNWFKDAGTRMRSSSGGGTSFYSRNDLNNPNIKIPAQVRKILEEGANWAKIDSKGSTQKSSNKEAMDYLKTFIKQDIKNSPWKQESLEFEYGENWNDIIDTQLDNISEGMHSDVVQESGSNSIGIMGGMSENVNSPYTDIPLKKNIRVTEEENVEDINERYEQNNDAIKPHLQRKKAQQVIEGTKTFKDKYKQRSGLTEKEFTEFRNDMYLELSNEYSREEIDLMLNQITKKESAGGGQGQYGISANTTIAFTNPIGLDINSYIEKEARELLPNASEEKILELANNLQYNFENQFAVVANNMYSVPAGNLDDDLSNNLRRLPWYKEGEEANDDNLIKDRKLFSNNISYNIDLRNERVLIVDPTKPQGANAYIPFNKFSEDSIKEDLKSFSSIAKLITSKEGKIDDPKKLRVFNNSLFRKELLTNGFETELGHLNRITEFKREGTKLIFKDNKGDTGIIEMDGTGTFTLQAYLYNAIEQMGARAAIEGKASTSDYGK